MSRRNNGTQGAMLPYHDATTKQHPNYERSYGDEVQQGIDHHSDQPRSSATEVKAAQKAGSLPKCKVSIRTSYYSGGSSITVSSSRT